MAKREFTTDEIARSFVTAFLKTAAKELSLRQIIKTAQALALNDRFREQRQTDALQPESITKACKTLSQWNQISLVSPDVYCLPQFMPKYRTLDDTWLS